MKHVQECKNIRAGAMIVLFNYREDEKQERNKCKTSASESAAFQVLQQPAVADISGRLEEGFWQTQLFNFSCSEGLTLQNPQEDAIFSFLEISLN